MPAPTIAESRAGVLEALDRGGALPMGELAQHALVEPPTLTKIIDRMVSEALVFRSPDPNDRRRVLILLAPAGKALFRRLRKVSSEKEMRLARHLQPDKADALRNLLRELMRSRDPALPRCNASRGFRQPACGRQARS